jgi:fatty acid desaturase
MPPGCAETPYRLKFSSRAAQVATHSKVSATYLSVRKQCVPERLNRRKVLMLWTIFVILVVLWLLGFSLHIAGGLIHLLLVVALVVLLIQLFTGRRV